jgi:hypothetical protein
MKKFVFCFMVIGFVLAQCTTACSWVFSWRANEEPIDFYEVCWGLTPNLEIDCYITTNTLIELHDYLFIPETRYFSGARACINESKKCTDFSKTASVIDVYPRTLASASSDYDGDGIIDRAFRTSNYYLMVDFSNSPEPESGFNSPGTFDLILPSHGGVNAHMIRIDYDKDGKEDMVHIRGDGSLFVDLASNGFKSLDIEIENYFTLASTGIDYQVFAVDHDGDGTVDISINTKDWDQFIDYGDDGYGNLVQIYGDYGGLLATFVPIDYDFDGLVDIGIITGNGTLHVDLANNGFYGYDYEIPFYVFDDELPVEIKVIIADHDGDNIDDISIMQPNWLYYIDYGSDGYGNPVELIGPYGGDMASPILIDEDMDGKMDIGILKGNGEVQVDLSANGFHGIEKTLTFH